MYKHGIEVVEKATAYEQPLSTRYGVQVLVGTAPVNLVENVKVNQPVRVSSWDEAEELLGYSDDWEKYTLCQSMVACFRIFRVYPVIFINVLDPAKHKKENEAADHPVVNHQVNLGTDVIKSSVVVKAESAGEAAVLDEDYMLSFNEAGELILTLLSTGSLYASPSVNVASSSLDPSKITEADIIGARDAETGVESGLEVIRQVYPRFGLTPALLAAPGSQEYTLYDLDAPVEELTGTLNISMITEPGYELDLDAAVFTINGQTYSNGSSAVITAPSASVGSSIVCREAAAEFPEEPEAPAEPEVPTQPQAPETAETPSEPENQESHQETLSDPEPQPTPDTSLSEEAPAETQNFASPESSADTRTSPGAYQAETSETDIPELLTVTPITGYASETAQNSEAVPADHPSAGAAAGSPAETFRSSDASVLESSADTVLSSEAQTKELPSGVHTSDRIRQINFVLAVLTLIVLILLLTRLILTLKRERRNRQYR